MKKFIQSWLINTFSVLVAVYLLKDRIRYGGPLDLAIASLILGILNAVLKPLLMRFALPLLLLTLGLFTLVINALLLYVVGLLLRPHFSVESFSAAFWGALIISVVSLILNMLTGTGTTRVKIVRGKHRSDQSGKDGGSGPVIDI